ncbi:MAG: hypothetical protein M1834_008501 [Cirrosporium novae-zelandiae]|nr:MAG: hypothetical protein M1834_008501 [Cirrosporium novae-zelandiae]
MDDFLQRFASEGFSEGQLPTLDFLEPQDNPEIQTHDQDGLSRNGTNPNVQQWINEWSQPFPLLDKQESIPNDPGQSIQLESMQSQDMIRIYGELEQLRKQMEELHEQVERMKRKLQEESQKTEQYFKELLPWTLNIKRALMDLMEYVKKLSIDSENRRSG